MSSQHIYDHGLCLPWSIIFLVMPVLVVWLIYMYMSIHLAHIYVVYVCVHAKGLTSQTVSTKGVDKCYISSSRNATYPLGTVSI